MMLAALKLGFARLKDEQFMTLAATEGQRQEDWIAHDLRAQGYKVEESVECKACQRNGTHCELETPAFKIIGHLDRLVTDKQGRSRFAEFKALGRFRSQALWRALDEGSFRSNFQEYAYQVSVYAYATGLSPVYVVKSRDTGEMRVYEDVELVPKADIFRHIGKIEIAVRRGVLPNCTVHPNDFYYKRVCPVRYLHPEVALEE